MERKNEAVTRERIEKLSTEDICEIQRNGSIANADEKDQVEAKNAVQHKRRNFWNHVPG